MPGETNLTRLLSSMQPTLREGEYVFCTLPSLNGQDLDPLGFFREEEGMTLILPRHQAEAAGLPYSAVFAMITLSVHSSLEAVGFLAAIATRLASHGISVNPVSAFYHDHLFVPVAQAETAIALLHELVAENGTNGS
ncbi:ACT domain-containing protein [Phormidium tenue]|uniref:Transporter n=1 Tax=Phormidium tenue NIES-30 TaxID=549789 RepID=A0A1U7J3V4_9CYAN|nr:ACT domain-containing protein [Phormidium tenue]MBD2233047.1 ACT domain-containing protein [Phormidium tenue FACHB-1052]OKH47137.1 transporter [Phormidium tenue NIES-30]